MHSSRMHTTHFGGHHWMSGLVGRVYQTPGTIPPSGTIPLPPPVLGHGSDRKLHHTPGQTNMCKNITFPQLRLRAVIIIIQFKGGTRTNLPM